MTHNGQLTQDAELRLIDLSVVSAQRPSRCLGYGHMSRSAKRVGNDLRRERESGVVRRASPPTPSTSESMSQCADELPDDPKAHDKWHVELVELHSPYFVE